MLLSAVLGPLGLLSHIATAVLAALFTAVTGRDLRGRIAPVRRGGITLMPYVEGDAK